MILSDILATVGVIMMLVAFLLNLFNKIEPETYTYTLLNFFGALLCCIASTLINFYPFIFLEGIWAVFSLIEFLRLIGNEDTK